MQQFLSLLEEAFLTLKFQVLIGKKTTFIEKRIDLILVYDSHLSALHGTVVYFKKHMSIEQRTFAESP